MHTKTLCKLRTKNCVATNVHSDCFAGFIVRKKTKGFFVSASKRE